MDTTNVQKNGLTQLIQTASPSQLISSQEVADRFRNLYQIIHGSRDGLRIYEAEKFHFLKLLQENPKIGACTKLSLYGVFLDVAVNGLSFDPSKKMAYVVPYKNKTVRNNQEVWETRAQLQISPYGELALRQKFGQIKHADNPILVFEGDYFKMCVKEGKTSIEYEMMLPRNSDKIVGCFLTITRNDGSIDYKVLSMDEIERLRKFSKDPNSKAWTDGLAGMVQAKTIKHAFRSYPKIKVGEFSALSSETIDEEAEVVNEPVSRLPEHIDYGMDDTGAPSVPQRPAADNRIYRQKEYEVPPDDSFVNNDQHNDTSGITHDDDNF